MGDLNIQDPEYGHGPPKVAAIRQTWWEKHQSKLQIAGITAAIIAALTTVSIVLVSVLREYNNVRNHYDQQINAIPFALYDDMNDHRKELSKEIKALDSRLRVTENDVTELKALSSQGQRHNQ